MTLSVRLTSKIVACTIYFTIWALFIEVMHVLYLLKTYQYDYFIRYIQSKGQESILEHF